MSEYISKMPKVELHLHLDGSISIETAKKLSGKSEEEIKRLMIAPDKCKDLADYLTKFKFPISLMQTPENLLEISHKLVDDLEKHNVVYAEIRFAPMFHTSNGLTQEKVVESVLEGLRQNKNVKTNLILCLMRGMGQIENLETVKVARDFFGRGVCALDLAGDEAHYPVQEFEGFFELAKKCGIPFTIHSGEAGPAQEVKNSIEIGARRIGHGIHCIEDPEVIELVKDNNVLLEVCPTSNVQTNAVSDLKSHPIKKLYDMGVMVSVNTDNMTVSNISLPEEYEKLEKEFKFTEKDFEKMNMYALDRAFVTPRERKELKEKYHKKMLALNEKEHDDR